MTETSVVMKYLGGIGAFLAVGIPIFSIGQYVSDLKHEMTESRSEVERLKGQVDQLQAILQKTQSVLANGQQGIVGPKGDTGPQGPIGPPGPQGRDADPGRLNAIETKLEKLSAAIRKNADATAPIAPSSIPAPQQLPKGADAYRSQMIANGFEGISSNGRKAWPFVVRNVVFDGDSRFQGQLEWPTLGSLHLIEGTLSDGILRFKEVKKLREGKALLGCVYSVDVTGPAPLQGHFTGCGSDGSVSIN